MSELNLVLPGLIWPNIADYEYLSSKIHMPYFANFCAKAKLSQSIWRFSDFIYAWQSNAGLSLANSYAKQLGISGYLGYMLLEPTHLRLDRDRLLISEPELLQLNSVETEQIISLINEHFCDEVSIFKINDELWLIGVNFELDKIVSYPLIDIVGENIDEFLPSGSQRIQLHKLMNEIQMLLFDLPLNKQREIDGLLSINSVWIWDKFPREFSFEFGNLLPRNFDFANGSSNLVEGINTLIVDKAYFPACYRDSFSWLESVSELDQSLGHKLMGLFRSGKIKQLNIHLPVLDGCYHLRVSRFDLFKFWRKKVFAWQELVEIEVL